MAASGEKVSHGDHSLTGRRAQTAMTSQANPSG
jgi:hypothetical protein